MGETNFVEFCKQLWILVEDRTRDEVFFKKVGLSDRRLGSQVLNYVLDLEQF